MNGREMEQAAPARGLASLAMKSPIRSMLNAHTTHDSEGIPAVAGHGSTSPRFPVLFRSVTARNTGKEQRGCILDLSVSGCDVEAPVAVQKSLLMELRIFVPDLDWPIMVDGAVVQWVKGNTFGLHFLQLPPVERDRLTQVIGRIAEDAEHIDGF